MPINPQPKALIDGSWINCAGENAGTQVTALAGVAIRWGRDNVFEHARPATAQLRLFDPTGNGGTWATKVRTRSVLGRTSSLYYFDGDLGRDYRFFHGTIAGVAADRATILHPKTRQRVHGWMITLTVTSREAEAANVTAKKNDVWPPETAINRAIRINDYQLPHTGIQSVFFEPNKTDWTMWGPDDPSGATMIEHLGTFYQSMGTSFSYWPDENVIRYTGRYAINSGGIVLATLPDDGGPRQVVIRPSYSFNWYNGDITSWSTHMPGNQCTPESGIEVARSDGINRVQLDWRDRHQTPAWGDWSTLKPDPMPSGQQIRLFRATSWLDDGIYLDPTVDRYHDIATNEASIPPHPPITWHTRANGGFHKWTDARHLLHAGEWPHFTFLSGSWYSQWLDAQAPVFGRIGGTIDWDGEHWTIGSTLQWVNLIGLAPSVNLTWQDLEAMGIEWGPPPPDWTPNQRFLHPSITWDDLKHVTSRTLFNY